MIDRDIHLARALLVEGNPLLRSVATGQLRDLGVGHVQHTARVKEARLLLERDTFDIVICNREFDDSADYSGQDLLDELRREQLLPHSTVFLMVVTQATYHQVMEAAEAALDGVLVRPYTAASLGTRLMEARNRKRELSGLLRALDAGQTELALLQAIKRFQEQQAYWRYCGRLAAELMLTLQRPADARKIFEHLAQTQPKAGWAKLGIARALIAASDNNGARKAVAEVLAADPASADAHDLLGHVLIDQSDFEGALVSYRSAAELTPGCLLRLQHAGALAFFQGQPDAALRWLDRTVSMGAQSKLFDPLNLLLLAMLRFDRDDGSALGAMRDRLRQMRERQPESARLQRFEQGAAALVALRAGLQDEAIETMKTLALQAQDDSFDLESANLLLALWSRLPAEIRPAAEFEALVERIGMRFCTSKATAEVLVAAARPNEAAQTLLRRCQARILAQGEQAMELSLRGDPGAAALMLLERGEKALNAKLLDMAGLLVRRHQATLPDAAELAERAAAGLRRSGPLGGHISGIQRPGRSPGGLQLRGAVAQSTPASTPAVVPVAAAAPIAVAVPSEGVEALLAASHKASAPKTHVLGGVAAPIVASARTTHLAGLPGAPGRA